MLQIKPLSASALKSLSHSPERCFQKHVSSQPREETRPSDAVTLGLRVHDLLLQNGTQMRAMPDGMFRRGSEYNELRSVYGERNLVPYKLNQKAEKLVDLVRNNEEAYPIISGRRRSVQNECRHEWYHDDWHLVDPVWMVAIFDHVNTNMRRVTDVKTIANLDNLDRTALKDGWHIQAAVYEEGAKHYLCSDQAEVNFLVIETGEPNRIRTMRLCEDVMAVGREELKTLRRDYINRLNEGDWAGDTNLGEMTFPRYFWSQYDAS